jgi:hypothetical protein
MNIPVCYIQVLLGSGGISFRIHKNSPPAVPTLRGRAYESSIVFWKKCTAAPVSEVGTITNIGQKPHMYVHNIINTSIPVQN